MPLSHKDIINSLKTKQDVFLEIFDTIDSTNQYYVDNDYSASKVRICLAEFQSSGKGRLGRTWISPPKQNICLSICTLVNRNINELGGLSIAISISVAKTLQKITNNKDIKVKWPNDIIYKKHKLSGSLLQVIPLSNGICKIIIGIGLNVNADDASFKGIEQKCTSLKQIIGKDLDRNFIAAQIINGILAAINTFIDKGLEHFITEWNKNDFFFKKEVSLLYNEKIITGIDKGVDNNGYILLQTPDGRITAFSCGETTFAKPK